MCGKVSAAERFIYFNNVLLTGSAVITGKYETEVLTVRT